MELLPELSRFTAEGRNRSAACRSCVGRVQSWGWQGEPGGGDQERGSGQREMGCCIFSLTSRRGRLTTQAAGRVLSVGPAMQVAGDVSPARRSRFSGQFSLCLLLRSSSHQVLTWLPCPEHKMPGAITNLKPAKLLNNSFECDKFV